MSKTAFPIALAFALSAVQGYSEGLPEGLPKGVASDTFDAGTGTLEIVFLGHSSLILVYGGANIYIDPVSQYADYSRLPKADLILVTHQHGDHLDPKAIAALLKPETRILLSKGAYAAYGSGEALDWGRSIRASGVEVAAVPAYNTTPEHLGYHPRERRDNGYVVGVGKLRVYIAGDTEPTAEMAELGRIDIAFLPMNQPYTMTPAQTAAAARTIKPAILYPYHLGSTDTRALAKLLERDSDIDLRIRNLQ